MKVGYPRISKWQRSRASSSHYSETITKLSTPRVFISHQSSCPQSSSDAVRSGPTDWNKSTKSESKTNRTMPLASKSSKLRMLAVKVSSTASTNTLTRRSRRRHHNPRVPAQPSASLLSGCRATKMPQVGLPQETHQWQAQEQTVETADNHGDRDLSTQERYKYGFVRRESKCAA